MQPRYMRSAGALWTRSLAAGRGSSKLANQCTARLVPGQSRWAPGVYVTHGGSALQKHGMQGSRGRGVCAHPYTPSQQKEV